MVIYVFLGIIIAINFYAYLMVYLDKQYAKQAKRRIPEKKIWRLSLFGGAMGSYVAMKKHRHKTKHQSFMIGMPIIIVFHILIVSVLIYYDIFNVYNY
ncbi:DUF1294 domain-containing protein [Bacillus solimangrovi]|uniref:DUF1294 domain-containing protein n=1 Tax=Bacillus solimangrovi TaxID=1305675 RepID=A0A1E5LCW2_9BACI|nr:DUF1294 domain-containing protein [Bacillus solimangrovi]OEH91879.1 hypothetical protein BFG57_03850 [Bacillus solimangrovi]